MTLAYALNILHLSSVVTPLYFSPFSGVDSMHPQSQLSQAILKKHNHIPNNYLPFLYYTLLLVLWLNNA